MLHFIPFKWGCTSFQMAYITRQSSLTKIKSTQSALQSALPGWGGRVVLLGWDLVCVSFLDGTQHSRAFVQTGAFPEEESTWIAAQEAAFSSWLRQASQVAVSNCMPMLLLCKTAIIIPPMSFAYFCNNWAVHGKKHLSQWVDTASGIIHLPHFSVEMLLR